jgi:hypothetical protein
VLASDVVAVGLPGFGQGPAAQLLAAGADGLLVTLPRGRLLADPDPVAPPPTPDAVVFAVENEALLSWAWRACGLARGVVVRNRCRRQVAHYVRAGWLDRRRVGRLRAGWAGSRVCVAVAGSRRGPVATVSRRLPRRSCSGRDFGTGAGGSASGHSLGSGAGNRAGGPGRPSH